MGAARFAWANSATQQPTQGRKSRSQRRADVGGVGKD
jgi:hypothetical protein